MPDLKAGKPEMGLILSLLWESFCGIIVFQLVRHPPRRHGIRFYRNYAPHLVVASSLSLNVGYFSVGFRTFGNSCPAVSCDFGVLIRTSERMSFSTISSSPGSSRKPELRFVLFVCLLIFIYLCLAVLCLCCFPQTFSSCSKQVLLSVMVCKLLIMASSLVVEHRL